MQSGIRDCLFNDAAVFEGLTGSDALLQQWNDKGGSLS